MIQTSEEKKVTYIKIFKNASRSITKALFPNEYLLREWKGYKSFCIVRNPVDRFKSAVNMFMNRKKLSITGSDDLLDLIEYNKDPNEYSFIKMHCLPQTDPENRLEEVTKVYRLENLKDDWEDLCTFVGLEEMPELVHIGKSTTNLELTSEQKERIYNLYKKDFEELNYDI